ncbi:MULTISPECIES: dihydrofolate reductase family protein [unclassified Streptomyces]|uniref:dihydrofolate reductase family protein n=1 Tax=unclassified Streptomyces TaxID=2593676 RepID=UPI001660CBA4|nr:MULTISPECIES: dihydrofolate reductase [unclassified Streptomyces]MBD0707423.1 deaminase [Streptomyces sp. CBMA291]MBD0715125.1 deaminase [Streptomyces sp. CBMA370]
MRKLTYYIACTIDGFIGDPEGDATSMFGFLDPEYLEFMNAEYPETVPAHGREAFGVDGENRHFDTVVQGMRSYRLALDIGVTSPYGHLREYVATRSLAESPHPDVELIADDLVGRIRELKAEDGPLGIYLCGGSVIAGELIEEIDELIIKTYPQVYGTGMPMFGADFEPRDFTLGAVRVFGNGVLVRTYTRKRPDPSDG